GLPLTFFVAAAAAQPDYDWWVRLLVAGLVLWAGRNRGHRIALLVGPWPLVALLTLLHLVTPASA
nr:putative protein p7 [GB virus-B]